MQEKQFSEMMGKLEEIRCGIIDVETASEKADKADFIALRDVFFKSLERKTGLGRNELMALFIESVASLK